MSNIYYLLYLNLLKINKLIRYTYPDFETIVNKIQFTYIVNDLLSRHEVLIKNMYSHLLGFIFKKNVVHNCIIFLYFYVIKVWENFIVIKNNQ